MIRESSEDVFLRFEIRDTGIGMSKDAMSRIFEPFEQADTSTTRKYGGIGLGVVISRQIVVLMDCQMPEMDGYEATEAIRSHADERIRNTIVIAMTANAITGEKDRCLEVGMNDFVAKPVNMRTLSEVLERNLTFDRVLQTPRVRTPDEVRLA